MARKAQAKAAPRQDPPPLAAPAPVAATPVVFANWREAAEMMRNAVAVLPPAQALDRLRAVYATLPPGTARRAVLAARIAIIRDNLPAQAALPLPKAEPAAAPPPPPPQKPLKAGALSTLALEDAARMLMLTDEDTPDDPPPVTAKPDPAALLAGMDDAFAALGSDDPVPEPEPEPEPEEHLPPTPAKAKKSRAPKAMPAFDDPFAAFDTSDGSAAAAEVPQPAFQPTPPSEMATILPEPEPQAAPKPRAPRAKKPKAPTPDLTVDLSAAFSAIADDADDAPPPELVEGVADRLSELDHADGTHDQTVIAPMKPAKRGKAPTGMSEGDVAASLAALMGGNPAPSAPAPATLDPEVSEHLTALEAAFAEDAKPRPSRKLPTDLSAISATFAALDKDDD